MNALIKTYTFPSSQRLELVHGDLTEETVDAIVNAANAHLQHGGGVAGAIARRGGPEIQAESDLWVRQHGPVSHDAPAYTGPGRLACKFVIHAVGPAWGEGQEDEKLGQAITGALRLADRLGLVSLSLPPISTGIFGFPKERAAGIIYRSIADYFSQHPDSKLAQVRLVVIDAPTLEILSRLFPDHPQDKIAGA